MRYLLYLALILPACAQDTRRATPAASLACDQFTELISDARSGVITDAEFRDRMKDVYETAKYSGTPEIAEAARLILAGATTRDTAEAGEGMRRFTAACRTVRE